MTLIPEWAHRIGRVLRWRVRKRFCWWLGHAGTWEASFGEIWHGLNIAATWWQESTRCRWCGLQLWAGEKQWRYPKEEATP